MKIHKNHCQLHVGTYYATAVHPTNLAINKLFKSAVNAIYETLIAK